MLASRFLHRESDQHGRIYNAIEAVFDAIVHGYERGLDLVLRHRFITLMTFFATMALTGYLFVIIPKGFFPTQDNGLMIGIMEAAQDVSPIEMKRLQRNVAEVLSKDPDIAAFGSFFGSGNGNTLNTARFFIGLKPHEQRTATASQIIARLRPQIAKLEGVKSVPATGAGHHGRRPHLARPVPVHVAGPGPERAEHLGAEGAREVQDAARTRGRLDRPAIECAAALDQHQPRRCGTLRHPAAGDRRYAQ